MLRVSFARPEAEERIRSLALQLSGLSAPPENADVLFETTVRAALNLCGRNDVPEGMEAPLGIILAGMYQGGLNRPVSVVKRGDTSITYAGGSITDTRAVLAPFIRLRTAE